MSEAHATPELISYLGEGFHTAFRKAVDSSEAMAIWEAIAKMPKDDWHRVLVFVADALVPAWDKLQTPRRVFEIWSEGFVSTGERGVATRHGAAEGATFREACDAFAASNAGFAADYNSKYLTYWGCRLFATEAEARISFG